MVRGIKVPTGDRDKIILFTSVVQTTKARSKVILVQNNNYIAVVYLCRLDSAIKGEKKSFWANTLTG